jgi:hypothetical protein
MVNDRKHMKPCYWQTELDHKKAFCPTIRRLNQSLDDAPALANALAV